LALKAPSVKGMLRGAPREAIRDLRPHAGNGE